MAIRRCPYCKAIIDEGLEYCSNCGTQLIFPEDEFADEEIPGEKIVDVTEEEDEPELDELSEASKDLEAGTEDIELEKTGEMADQEVEAETSEVTEEEDLEIETSEAEDLEDAEDEEEEEIVPDSEETFVETDELEKETEVKMTEEEVQDIADEQVDIEEETSPEEEDEELEERKQLIGEEVLDDQPIDDSERPATDSIPDSVEISQVEEVFPGLEGDTGLVSPEAESVDFKTEDLEKIIDPAEKEKEEIEQFLNSLKQEREKTKKYYEETGELPPWAQTMKEGSISSMTSDEEIIGDEETIPPEEEELIEEESQPVEDGVARTDTGMGLPEGIEQKGLPFNQNFQEGGTIKERETHFGFRDLNFPLWIKSRVFDVLMIVGLWLIAVWVASIVAKASFFQLITVSTIPILIFLAILLIVYFFLFFFFLGETLGDQLFSQEE